MQSLLLGNRVLECSSPHPIDLGSNVTSISCGENHSLLLTEDGHLYTFGDGRHGKLCHDTTTITNCFSPTLVERFKGIKISIGLLSIV